MAQGEDCSGQHQARNAASMALAAIPPVHPGLESVLPLEKASVETQTFNQLSGRCCEGLGRMRSERAVNLAEFVSVGCTAFNISLHIEDDRALLCCISKV